MILSLWPLVIIAIITTSKKFLVLWEDMIQDVKRCERPKWVSKDGNTTFQGAAIPDLISVERYNNRCIFCYF